MKTMVIYDSAFGNTERVARAIAQALGSPEAVKTVHASEVQPEHLAGLELLVVGSPTQKFRPLPAVTGLLKRIPDGGLKGVKVAAFDTRVTESEVEKNRILSLFVRLFGYAAQPIADWLEKKGGQRAAAPEGFYVGGTEGPLLEGELERAAKWAQGLAQS